MTLSAELSGQFMVQFTFFIGHLKYYPNKPGKIRSYLNFFARFDCEDTFIKEPNAWVLISNTLSLFFNS